MTFKFVSTALAGLILSISTIANAGLIVDTDNDSFIDQSTGLEWMDFGVNNIYSFDQTLELIKPGEIYSDWRLATRQEAFSLWKNAFIGMGADGEVQNPDNFDFIYAWDNSDSNPNHDSIWEDVFDIMGYNHRYAIDMIIEENQAQALFFNDDGSVGYAYFNDNKNSPQFDYNADDFIVLSSLADDASHQRNQVHTVFSSLLVKPVQSVPEPSTLAIFALGMIGLASRRFKK
jgi:hypothetical protein